jgi:predicted flap endonuclease-1-like 5' DNA nuclease
MGVFTEDMARLGEEIASGRACRKKMLHNLKSDIATLRTDVAEMLTEYEKKRIETRQLMQLELSTFTSHLQHFAGELGEQVLDMRKGFHQERTDMLGRMNDRLRRFISALKTGVAEMQTGFKMQRAESSRQIRTDMDAFLGRLKSFSQNTQTSVGSMLAEFQSDRQGGGRSWKEKDRVAPQPQLSNPPETAGQDSDDLTQIPGIGARRQQLLNRAGIHSLARLAQSTPEQLMQALGNHGGPARVEVWIAHAQAMGR